MSSDTHTSELPTLLRTKLHRPPITADLVPRPRLLERLDQRRERPLTLVSAPAGYGKTTLVSSWLEASDWPSVWLSLDEDDNDLYLFLSYFLAAVKGILPEACQETEALLKASALPPTPVLARCLINELDEIGSPFILTLDDYHHIHETAVHDLLGELLRHPPRPMHLVLASRREPSIDLTRLRARSQVTEIRTHDLRFTQEETAAFLEHELRTPVKTSAVEALIGRVEGWAAGLRLITLSLRHRDSLDLSPARQDGGVASVTDYLMAEVLAGQPPAIQDFLLKTSILDRLSGPLCDAVCFGETKAPSSSGGTAVTGLDEPERNGQAHLERLHRTGLFTIPLDNNREWYRYHHLFRGLLRGQSEGKLGADGIAALHSRASTWFAQNGLIDEALHHALAADDMAAAVELVAQHRHDLLNRERWRHLERWLRLFDRSTIEHSPDLSITEAWISEHHGLFEQEIACIDRAERLLAETETPPDRTGPIRGEIHLLRAHQLVWFYRGSEALAMLEPAKELLPPEWHYAHAGVDLVYGYGHAQTGKQALAEQHILARLSDRRTGGSPVQRNLLLHTLSYLHWVSLRLHELKVSAARYRDLGRKYNLPQAELVGWYFLGCAHYHHNELNEAEHCFRVAASKPFHAYLHFYALAVCGLAFTYQASNRPEQALELLVQSQREMADHMGTWLSGMLQAGQAEVALAQGNIAAATRWAESYDTGPLVTLHYLYIPQLTLVKVWLAQNTATSRKKAAELLARLVEVARASHLESGLLQILPVQALLYDILGDDDATMVTLKEAVRLGEAEGLVRVFVNLGPKMAGLLDRLQGQGVAPDYVTQIVAAYHQATKDEGQKTKTPDPPPARVQRFSTTVPRRGPSSALVEPLTNRELDVLALLAQRLTNKEIAARLVISPLTVKKHTVSIYGKLGVNNRRQAVSRAAELGILPER